jgi:hypothetical protein
MMKLLLISDVDDLHWKHGSGQVDLILALGDLRFWVAGDGGVILV